MAEESCATVASVSERVVALVVAAFRRASSDCSVFCNWVSVWVRAASMAETVLRDFKGGTCSSVAGIFGSTGDGV